MRALAHPFVCLIFNLNKPGANVHTGAKLHPGVNLHLLCSVHMSIKCVHLFFKHISQMLQFYSKEKGPLTVVMGITVYRCL